MEITSPFFVRLDPDPWNARRSWWSICDGERVIKRSPYSYATRREAEAEGNEVMKRIEVRHRHK
jgi:hypothetical protein